MVGGCVVVIYLGCHFVVCFKQKTAYEIRISDWSSDVCSSDLDAAVQRALVEAQEEILVFLRQRLRNQDEAEEVLQRFSLRVLERSGQLRDVQTVRGWFGRILATTIVDHQRALARRHRREAAADSVDIEALPADPDAEIDAKIG